MNPSARFARVRWVRWEYLNPAMRCLTRTLLATLWPASQFFRRGGPCASQRGEVSAPPVALHSAACTRRSRIRFVPPGPRQRGCQARAGAFRGPTRARSLWRPPRRLSRGFYGVGRSECPLDSDAARPALCGPLRATPHGPVVYRMATLRGTAGQSVARSVRSH